MKPIALYACIIGTLLSTLATQLPALEYQIGIIEYPPHAITNKHSASGPALDYIQEIFAASGDTITFKVFPAKRGHTELSKGSVDLLYPVENLPKDALYLEEPLFKLVPGLCFRKENFIPILSATHRLKQLTIGYPQGSEIPKVLVESGAKLVPIIGQLGYERGIKMLKANRFGAVYNANPIFIYHYKNPLSKEIACSYFHGLMTNVYIAVSPKLTEEKYANFKKIYSNKVRDRSYTDFYNSK